MATEYICVQMVGWSLTSLFSTYTAISETRVSVNNCSVSSIGKHTETLYSGHLLPINKSSMDLGITVCDDLKVHILT